MPSPPPSKDAYGPGHPLYVAFFVASAILIAAFEFVYFHAARPPSDGLHDVIGRDFLNMWMGGKAALSGAPAILFDVHRYNAILHHEFWPSLPSYNWSYPPHILLLIWPFGLFGHLAGYALWLALGLTALALAAIAEKPGRYGYLFLIFAPVTALNVATGQNGFFTAALLITALSQWDRRPAVSGSLFGLLTIKPQLVLLVPVVVVITRRWRVLAFAAAATAALCLLTMLIWGPGVWRDYLRLAVPFQNLVMTHGPMMMQAMMPTPYMAARLLGFPPAPPC